MSTDFQVPSISSEQVDDNKGVFTIEPLDKGFGYTFGSSLRRVLLPSLGCAHVGRSLEMRLQPPPLALYIHIPWCVKKCPYCDFNSHELRSANEYIVFLFREVAAFHWQLVKEALSLPTTYVQGI